MSCRLLVPAQVPFGVLVVGRRFDGRVVRQADLPFLEALGSVGEANPRARLTNSPTAGPSTPTSPPGVGRYRFCWCTTGAILAMVACY